MTPVCGRDYRKVGIKTMSIIETSSILDMGHGAIPEIVQREMAAIVANILDPNTDAKKERSITIKFSFKPDANRQYLGMTTSAKSTLAPIKAYESSLFLQQGSDGAVSAQEITEYTPGQIRLDGTGTPDPVVIEFARVFNGG